MNDFNFTLVHLGDGQFEAILPNGSTKSVGPNTCGMIRYTYFEDYTIPPVGWSVENAQLLKDYFPKATKDIIAGKLKPNQMNY